VQHYITAKVTVVNDVKDLVQQYRANEVALRRITRRGGHRTVTAYVTSRRERARYAAEEAALAWGTPSMKLLVGALVQERQVIDRIYPVRDCPEHPQRPELDARLCGLRATIKVLTRRVATGR